MAFLLEKALPQLQASTNLGFVDITIISPSATDLMDIHSMAGCSTMRIMNTGIKPRETRLLSDRFGAARIRS